MLKKKKKKHNDHMSVMHCLSQQRAIDHIWTMQLIVLGVVMWLITQFP